MTWKRRLSDSEGNELRVELRAGIGEAKARGVRAPTTYVYKTAGVSQTFLHHILKGDHNGSSETAEKIRAALRKLQAEPGKPDADADTAAAAPRKGRTATSAALKAAGAAKQASQEPLRSRARDYIARHALQPGTLATRAGIDSSRIYSFLRDGKSLRTKNLAKLTRYLDRKDERARPPISAEKKAALVQQNFPFASVAVTATATATRIHRRDVDDEPKEGQAAHDIARAFVDRLGIEALETIISIARSRGQ